MEYLIGERDAVLHREDEFPIFLNAKIENKKEAQQNTYMKTIESNVNIKSEEVDIKLEELNCESVNSIKREYWESEIAGDFDVDDDNDIKQEECTNTDENQFPIKLDARHIEYQQTALTSTPVAVLLSNPKGGHTSVHQDTLENITSTFEAYPQVPNQGKRKSPKNKKYHTPLLKCEQCPYEAKWISKIRLHMRVHKDPSELNMYECTQCNFKSKHKKCLKGHSLLHKDAADIPKYKCYSCDFETKRKDALKRHLQIHQRIYNLNNSEKVAFQKTSSRNNSEKVFRCEQCSYECSYLSRLCQHIRVHKDPSELNMYECSQCDFKTKHKNCLRKHSIAHKDPDELPSYKCNSCNYETKKKEALRSHISRQRNSSRQNTKTASKNTPLRTKTPMNSQVINAILAITKRRRKRSHMELPKKGQAEQPRITETRK